MSQKKCKVIRRYLQEKGLNGKVTTTEASVNGKIIKVIHSIARQIKNLYSKANHFEKRQINIGFKNLI